MAKSLSAIVIALAALLAFAGIALSDVALGARPALSQSFTPAGGPSLTPTCGPSWSIVSAPGMTGGSTNLTAVAALTANDVWSVGYYTSTNGLNHTLIEHWNGSQWSITPNSVEGGLYGISALSPTDIWAVGYNGVFPGPYVTLAMHWNGTLWSVVPTPNPGTGGQLLAVHALAPGNVWAAGTVSNNNTTQTLIIMWDGSQWSVVPSANNAPNDELAGIFALSPDDIWAVGGSVTNRQYYTMAQHWDGTQWSIASLPNLRGYLYSVVAFAPDDVWAAGYTINNSVVETLTEHWNGAQWSVVPSPNPGTPDNFIQALSGVAPNDIWAVGTGPGTLTLHWDGAAWSVVPSPNVQGGGILSGVDALSHADVWAVGTYYDISLLNYNPLVEHYADPCAALTPTITPTRSPTRTPISGFTATPNATPNATPCAIAFSDVQPADYFYEAVRYLYCHGAISGYGDGTFRPYNNTTRGQLSKIIVLAEGLPVNTTGGPHFTDVPEASPFYAYVETAYNANLISGYADNTFRPGNNVTRGQLCKIIVLAQNWTINTAGGPHFTDVPLSNPFYAYIETAYSHAIISGYNCGTNCLEFRPSANATRGQISKIVYNAVTGGEAK